MSEFLYLKVPAWCIADAATEFAVLRSFSMDQPGTVAFSHLATERIDVTAEVEGLREVLRRARLVTTGTVDSVVYLRVAIHDYDLARGEGDV